jgi:hypothetical protein
MLRDGILNIVTLEAGGVLVDGTAAGVAEHVEKTWERGNEVIRLLLREDLIAHHGLEVADQLVPLRRGGVKLLKIGSTMTDTCNTMVGKKGGAVLKIAEKKEASGIAEYGAEDWATMPEEVTKMLSYFCSNHTRNLPVVAFNKLFNACLVEVLGDKFDAHKSASSTHARVEQNGEALLRGIAKLSCDGHDLHSKGDGLLLIRDWLKENYPDLIVKSVLWVAWSCQNGKIGHLKSLRKCLPSFLQLRSISSKRGSWIPTCYGTLLGNA